MVLAIFCQRVAGDMLDNLYSQVDGVLSIKKQNSLGIPIDPNRVVSNTRDFIKFIKENSSLIKEA